MKYGIRDYRGGGRSSARETAMRVAIGAICRKLIKEFGIEVGSRVTQIYNVKDFTLFLLLNLKMDSMHCLILMHMVVKKVELKWKTLG